MRCCRIGSDLPMPIPMRGCNWALVALSNARKDRHLDVETVDGGLRIPTSYNAFDQDDFPGIAIDPEADPVAPVRFLAGFGGETPRVLRCRTVRCSGGRSGLPGIARGCRRWRQWYERRQLRCRTQGVLAVLHAAEFLRSHGVGAQPEDGKPAPGGCTASVSSSIYFGKTVPSTRRRYRTCRRNS